jgi:hypothetical protein
VQLKKVLPGKVVSRKHKNSSPRGHGGSKILKRSGADDKKLESVGDTSQVSKHGLSRDNSSKRRKANLSHSKSSNKRSKQTNSND